MTDDDKASTEFEDSYDDERELHHVLFAEELGHVPRRDPLIVEAHSSVADAIRAMNEMHVGCALVVREGKLTGIFTERDVLRKVAAQPVNVETTRVESVMTPRPRTLPPNASVAFALREMSVEGYRHIPLVNGDGTPAGVVAVRDIVSWLVDQFPASVHNLPPTAGVATSLDGG